MSESSIYVFSAFLVLAVLVGISIGALFQWGIHRRLYRLECEQADLEENLLTEKRKRAIKTRWDAGTPEQNLKAMLEAKPAERFANDGWDS
jgi:hypothetical protein